jgi:hypothetical protein
VTALYVKTEDVLMKECLPGHPPALSQSELVCPLVAGAAGFLSEHYWIRFVSCHLRAMFPTSRPISATASTRADR